MRKLIALLVLLALVLTSVVPIFAQDRPTVMELLQNDADGRFTTLVAAINASGAQRLIEGDGPITLLAPTNDAFAALEADTGMTQDQLLADKATLTKILLYHVIPGQYFFRNLTSGPTLATELLGQSVTFSLDHDLLANGAAINDTDNLASNGIVQVVDAVLLPPAVAALMPTAEPTAEATEAAPTEAAPAEATAEPTVEATPVAGTPAERPDILTLLQNDADGRFTTLVSALDAAGLSGSLSTTGFDVTLLAPTNDAFQALLDQTGMTADQLLADKATLTNILLYHMVPGKYLFRNLTGGPTLPTGLLGQSITFGLDHNLTANGAAISDPDNLASNGVVQVVDAVLLPPDIAAALIPATPEATEVPTEAAPTAAEATPEATEMPAASTPEPTPVAGVPAERPDILTLLSNDADGRFTTLVAAINASGALRLISGDGPITLLAPTNDAFQALLDQTGMTADQLLADKATLTQVLLYHMLPGQLMFRDLTGGPTLPTELLGQSVTFGLDHNLTANGVAISDPDNLASNGVVQVVDAVLLPPAIAAALIPATPEATETPEATPVAEGGAHVRFVQLATPAVAISVNGVTAANGIVTGALTQWLAVPAGTYEVGVNNSDGGSLLSFSVDVSDGDYVTVVLTGGATTLKANVLPENFSALGESVARLSVFNGVEGSVPYDVYLGNRLVITRLGYPGTLGDNDGFYSIDVPAGTYDVRFVTSGGIATNVASAPGMTVEAGKNYFIALSGTPDAVTTVTSVSDVPAS